MEYVPDGQALHEDSTVAPFAVENFPSAHKMQDTAVVAPDAVANVPGGHREQTDEATPAAYVPAPQIKQFVAP